MGASDYMVGNAPDIAHAGNYADMLMKGLSNVGESYQKGQDFRYKQRQQDLFQDPDSQAALSKALQTGDYNDLAQRIVKSGGVQAIPHIIPLLDQQAQSRFYDALRNVGGGGAQPSTGPNYSTTAQGPDTLQRGSQRIGTDQPSATDNKGRESIRTLTAAIANGVDVPEPKMQSFAQALGVGDPDAGLSPQQEALARRLIGTNVRGGSSQSAPPVTNDAASGQQGQQNPVVGGEGGSPISPVPSRGGGGIAPSGPRADGDQFSGRFNPNQGEPSTSRPTPIGDAREADAADREGQRLLTLSAAPRIAPSQAAAAKARGEALIAKAHQIREQLGTYNAPGTNPQIKGQLEQYGKVGEAVGKRIGEVIESGGMPARHTLNVLNTMEDALRQAGTNISTGPGAEAFLKVKQAAANLGIDVKGLPETETVQKLNAQLAAAASKAMTARPSQLEFRAFMQNNPGLMTSVKGSLYLISVLRQSTEQDIALSRKAMNTKNLSNWTDIEDRHYAQNPIKSPFTGKPLSGGETVATAGGTPTGGGSPKRYRWTPEGLQPQ